MLNCHLVKSPDQKKELICQFPGERLWIVSDLESKSEIQKSLEDPLSSASYNDRVLRASEFWKKQLLKTDSCWQVLPVSFASLLIEKWMEGELEAKAFGLSPKDAKRAYKTLEQILPLLCHHYGTDSMDHWFKENKKAKQRWHHWYQLGLQIWKRFNKKKMIPGEWIKALLINNEIKGLDSRPVVFDLDLAMDSLEAELIVNLSRWQQVDVIVPGPVSDKTDSAYHDLLDRCQPKNYSCETPQTQRHFLKYPSMLSEVKEAVARVRKWLDEGLSTHEIGIVSPVIENYWPTLNEFLEVEGIPVNKTLVIPLSQMESSQTWLSKMRLALGKMNRFDGQQVLYGKREKPKIEYKKFQRAFENIYDISDFNRFDEVKKQIPKSLKDHREVSFEDFLQWALSLLTTKEQKELSQDFFDFDNIKSVTEVLSFEKWLQVFENYFARTEKIISPAKAHGIFILSVDAAMSPALKRIFVLGLSENNLTENHNTALTWMDVESIKSKFGFNLPHADNHRLIKQLQWFQLKKATEIVFSHSETDFSGQFQAPGSFWLDGVFQKNNPNKLTSPTKTRWDEIMEYDPGLRIKNDGEFSTSIFDEFLETEFTVTESKGQTKQKESKKLMEQKESSLNQNLKVLKKRLKMDKGDEEIENVKIPSLSLSASSLEEYFKCPFRFFAKNKLHLEKNPSLDIDIDPMTCGSLLHSLCEKVVTGKTFSLSREEVETLVEKTRKVMKMEIYSQKTWAFQKPFYVQLILKFMESEKTWREKYPLTRTYGVEKEIKTKIKIMDKGFCFSDEGDIPFRGYIDRIDHNEKKQFAVIDYKTSDTGLVQFESWLKKGQFQLVLYSLALIDGVLDNESKNVVAAFYFILKKTDRSKGFFSEKVPSDFLPSKKNSDLKIQNLFSDTRELIGGILKDIRQGIFQPKPKDYKTCETCHWNKICRAPHLNH